MDGEEYKKCKNMAFFHSLTEENYDAIEKLIRSELGESCYFLIVKKIEEYLTAVQLFIRRNLAMINLQKLLE